MLCRINFRHNFSEQQQQEGQYDRSFILHKDRLFTLRGEKLVAFRAFRARARRNDYEMDYKRSTWILLLGLLEAS